MPKKTQTTKKKVVKVQAPPKRGLPNIDLSAHTERLCGLTDPFCDEAGKHQIPDQGAGHTFTEQIRYVDTLGSNTNGDCYYAVGAKANYPLLPSSAGNYAANWTVSNAASLLTTAGSEYRVISYGVRLISQLAATNCSGTLAIGIGAPPSVNSAIQLSPDGYTHYEIHAIGSDSEWHIVGSPLTAEYLNLETVGFTATTTADPLSTWNAIFINATGLPISTASCFRIEIVINVEFTFAPVSTLKKLARPQPVYNPSVMQQMNEVSRNHGHVIKGARDKVKAHLKREAKKAIVKHVLPMIAKKATALLV